MEDACAWRPTQPVRRSLGEGGRNRITERKAITSARRRIVPEFLIFTPLEARAYTAFECRAPLIREFWRDNRGQRRAGDPPQPDALRNLGASAAVILHGAVPNGGIRAGFGSASTLDIEDARDPAQELRGRGRGLPHSSAGSVLRRSQPINGSEFSFHSCRGNGE
jgi:hypothetical protein